MRNRNVARNQSSRNRGGGSSGGATSIGGVILALLTSGGVAGFGLVRRVAAQLWLWRWSLAPVLAPFAVAKALMMIVNGAGGPFPAALALLGAGAVAYVLAQNAWTKSGRERVAGRRRNERKLRWIRSEWSDIAYQSGLGNRDGEPPTILGIEARRNGVWLRFELPRGMEVADLTNRAEELAASFRCYRVKVSRGAKNNASIVELLVIPADPLAVGLGTWPLMPTEGAPFRNVADPVVIGVDEEGNRVELSMVEKNMLMGGIPGSGKSSTLQQIVAAYALCDPKLARLYLFDPKIVELSRWEKRATAFVGYNEWDKALAVLAHIRTEMAAAYAVLGENGLRKFRADTDPFTLIVIDELASYTGSSAPAEVRKEFNAMLADIVRFGRAAGFAVIASLQRPTKSSISSDAKTLFSLRVAMKVEDSSESEIILGSTSGADASDIDGDLPGVGLVKTGQAADVTRMRSFHLTDADLDTLVAAAGVTAEALDTTALAQARAPQAPQEVLPNSEDRELPPEQVEEPAVLVLDPFAVVFPEKYLRNLRDLLPQVSSADQAQLMVSAALADQAGAHVVSTRPQGRARGYWVSATDFTVRLTETHRVAGIYPPL